MSTPLSPYRKAYLKWKSLRLPWRKRILVGLDLQGNTYWEFRDSLSAARTRRIVQYPSTLPYSEVTALISPAWHQWLRHTRAAPPTLTEQAMEMTRQRQIKVLAAEADARWNAKESFLEAPATAPAPALDAGAGGLSEMTGTGGEAREAAPGKIETLARDEERTRVRGAAPPRVYTNPGLSEKKRQDKEEPPTPKKDDPWQKAKRGGPSEEWQPQAWNPGAATPRS